MVMPEISCSVNEIFSTYAQELEKVEGELLSIFNSSAVAIPAIGNYIVKSGGKRIRPLFLLISSGLCGFKGSSRFILAGIIEAIHTASLLHDDVIDGAELRRSRPTAHSLWGNQIVVLVGDFLYSNALRIAVQQQSQKIMETLSDATTRMTEAELFQLSKTGDPEIREEEYLKIIAGKTGALVSAACRLGAILGRKNHQYENALATFGIKTGMAFQMVDDILDYMAVESELGKRLGKDLEEGKITKPLIYLLQVCSRFERNEIKGIIGNYNKDNTDSLENLGFLFHKYKVIEESMKSAMRLIQEAKSELDAFETSSIKEELLSLADYALHRRN